MRFRHMIFCFLTLALLNIPGASADPQEEAAALNKQARSLGLDKKYPEAIKLSEKASTILETSLGPDHPDLGMTLYFQAQYHIPLGQYPEAERLLTRSIAILEKGPDHKVLLSPLYQLASLYRVQGRFAETEPLLKRNIEISEKVFGPDHVEVAIALRSLANLYRGQEDRKAEFETIVKRAKAIEAKTQ